MNQWTTEEDEYIRANYKELTAMQMCTKLPGRSRSAVIGRLHRLGLTKNNRPVNRAAPRPTVTVRPRPVESKRAVIKPQNIPQHKTSAARYKRTPKVYAPPVEPKHIELMKLKANECRWPYGDGPFTFCGHKTEPGESYCPHHVYLS